MNTPDLAIVVAGLTSLASTGALVYTVRRVSPWPKLPAAPQAPGTRSPRKPGGEQPATADGSVPPAGAP